MTSPDALAGLPAGGVFPLDFSQSFVDAAKGRQHNGGDEAVGLRYTFKPASITPSTTGEVEMDKGRPNLIYFDGQHGNQQVFDVREESSKSRECVLIWNPETASFTLSPLSTTLNLTLNRTLSAQPRPPKAAAAPSTKRKSTSPSHDTPATNVDRAKKPRPSEVAPPPPPPRPTKGGKGLPRKSLPAPTARKSLPVPAPKATGKYKSAEVIDESDDEEMEEVGAVSEAEAEGEGDGPEEEAEEDEAMDEFANMLSAELSGAGIDSEPAAEPVIDDSTEEEESSDDDL